MAPVVKAKGLAAEAPQPELPDVMLPKAMVSRQPRGPPPRASKLTDAVLPKARAKQPAVALPQDKQTIADLQAQLANASGIAPKDVKLVMDVLRQICTKSLREHGVFRLPGITMLRTKRINARPASTKKMFGKEVVLPAKPASKKVTAMVLKSLKDAVMDNESDHPPVF